MTKKEIVKSISTEMSLSQTVVHEVVQRTFGKIIETMIREGRIELRNFGVFEVRMRAPRKARNPQTNEHLEVPRRLVVTFKPGKEMSDRVSALPLEKMTGLLQRHLSEPSEDTAAATDEGEKQDVSHLGQAEYRKD